ncbi:MAG: hypothetical protein COA96_14585 [SAR86 cluster bacterium]|uniref:Metal-dependent hydrolase n=1 Tax=SAR86 cluster bacterium TaxID=2030880 RepID=A0A2A5ASR4_9GAMM|nr:MAG: hypothetical protein COA96_14585 [SAR86 cluster bacterium]
MIHILLHFLVPLLVAKLAFAKSWKRSYLLMIATMLVDLDHLLAVPIYDPLRCSIGFHPLHGMIPIGIYFLLCFIPKIRIIGIGLIIHMLLDAGGCLSFL